ncbi:hypothetical protein DFJ58DRAFT_796988 [Suillus subalutaceus]|uniref:uncharacterized protein n=1 Tax=Suillus subalutaceus TaxID=48586 RepID=UPI001B861FE4|nr:uncharacterized protein DFJ58DRAFT_796988 [Suillus subalutaceus]KAG1847825.1 hypothetical protein DFJ58DRAFT_796988 [Suillus subalutaceus]
MTRRQVFVFASCLRATITVNHTHFNSHLHFLLLHSILVPRISTTRTQRAPIVHSQQGGLLSLCAVHPSISGEALRVLARNLSFGLVIVFTSSVCLVH